MVPKYSAASAVTSRLAENKALRRLMLYACSFKENGLHLWKALRQLLVLNSYLFYFFLFLFI
jgi:hypothetical protein